jgi:prepilin-type processing-associated H-X9-DG protein
MVNGDTGWHSIVGTTISTFLCPSDASELAASGPLVLAVGSPATAVTWARGNYGANVGPGIFTYGDSDATTECVALGTQGILIENLPLFNGGQATSETYVGLAYPGGGVFIVNGGHPLTAITDGTSSTIMIDELRIGPTNYDLRGTWALGQAGGSISAGNGRFDGPGPNISLDGYDDIEGGDDRPDIQMGCDANASRQVTAKSRHPNGVVTGFADGHVQFVTNSVSQSVWFFLHSRNDGEVIPSNDY